MLKFLIGLCLILFSNLPKSQTQAAEFADLKSLQDSAIGDGIGFPRIRKFEGSISIGTEQSQGNISLKNAGDEIVSNHSTTLLRLGLGFSITPKLKAQIFSDLALRDYEEEGSGGVDTSVRSDLMTYQGGVNLVYQIAPFFLGGGLAAFVYGSEDRLFTYDASLYDQSVKAAAIPIVRLFAGVKKIKYAAGIGFKSFGKGQSAVVATSPDGEKLTYDIDRRSPMEISLDGRFKVHPSVDLAAALISILGGQGSERQDEWSIEYQAIDGKNSRQTGLKLRNSDSIKFSLGSRIRLSPKASLLNALSYTTASYTDSSLASPEHQNLGGLAIHLGGRGQLSKEVRMFLMGQYRFDADVGYKSTSDERSETRIDRTQRHPIERDEDVSLSQGSFQLHLGASLSI